MSYRCPHCVGRHEKAADGRACAAEQAEQVAQMEAELEAERRNERYFEERGGGEPEDPREVEAQMRDDIRREEAAAAYRAQHGGQPPF
jgi:hypothetical protein